jgi:hypothetical protein
LATAASSSHVTTDCSISFLWFFCPDKDATGDKRLDPLDTASGGVSTSSLVSLLSLFSSLCISNLCLSNLLVRMAAKLAV